MPKLLNKHHYNKNLLVPVVFALIFIALGAKLIFFSHASGLPPTVSISVPTNNALVCGGATTISASATDNSGSGLNNVQFKLDGTALGSAITSSPYNYSWDNWITDAATSGSHALTATATDNDTNATTSNSINVVISEPGDVDCDGTVSGHDLSILLANYSLSYPAAEFDGGSTVTGHDLSILLTNYGKSIPVISLSASPTSITSGNSSTLTWSATNATSCAAASPSGWTSSTSTSGTQSVSPTATTTYSLNCTGAGGTDSASATVMVSGGSASAGAKGISPGTGGETWFAGLSSADQTTWINTMKADGVQWARIDIYWDQSSNTMYITNDTEIQDSENAGINVDALLTTDGFSSLTPTLVTQACTTMVNHYKPMGVETYEAFNEMNINGYTGTTYEPLLQACYQAVKATDPSARVLLSGLANPGDQNTGGGDTDAADFMTQLYAAGGEPYFDAANMHPYDYNGSTNDRQSDIAGELRQLRLEPLECLHERHWTGERNLTGPKRNERQWR